MEANKKNSTIEVKIISGNSECTGYPSNNKSCEVIIEEDEQMEATIKWNGKSEVIILNRN